MSRGLNTLPIKSLCDAAVEAPYCSVYTRSTDNLYNTAKSVEIWSEIVEK